MTTATGTEGLPTGTVAFLMTDIEGSTQLVGRLGREWPELLDAHFALMRSAVETHGGTWISSEGDSVFAVFPSVRQAIAAAVQAQRALAGMTAPDSDRIKVRMGIHAGEAVIGGRDYTGIDVHRTARLAGSGHGGQILVSEAARSLTVDLPAADLSYRDLGTHQLRDIPAPERIYEVVIADLESDFPRLRTESSMLQTNLPAQLTRFVGRSRELRDISELLGRERLVTVTGPGGTGKTRLVIETARELLGEYVDGVSFVALDVVRESALVLPAIAASVSVAEEPGQSIAAVLSEHLREKQMLLILDNFEQVVEAAPEIGKLLRGGPKIRVLASSREPLAIAGEAVYPLEPLAVPAEPGKPTADQLQGLEAVDLFVDRARAVRPDFQLTDANAPAVAAICRRLDGLPLALELAAARSNVLTPDQILARLDRRLTLLASSRRDLPDRQRTLRGAIDWSHDLLSEAESVVFRRFSVFSGGADVDSLADVLDPDGEIGVDVLDVASALVDRSLLRSMTGGARNRLEMLETIQEYARERLTASGDDTLVRNGHATHFRRLAEGARDVLISPRRNEILDGLDRDLPNIRAALSWSLESGDFETALAIASDLSDYWTTRGHIDEGRSALTAALVASAGRPPTALRARGTAVAASLAAWHVDFAAAAELGAEALRLAEELGDAELMLAAYMTNGWATVGPMPAVSREYFARAVELARAQGDEAGQWQSLGGLSVALINLGELDEAMAVSVDVAERSERAGDLVNAGYAHVGIGTIKLRRGDVRGALSDLLITLERFREAHADIGVAIALDFIALIALQAGDANRAVRLGAFADRLRREAGGGGSTLISNDEPPLVQARRVMDPEEFDRAVARGETLSLDQAELEARAIEPVQRPT